MNINEFMKNNSIGILVEADLKNKIFFIRKSDIVLESYDLFEQLILFSSIERLFESVSGQMMPRMWTQGNTKCMISRFSAEKLIVLFYDKCLDAKDNYLYAKQLDAQLSEIF